MPATKHNYTIRTKAGKMIYSAERGGYTCNWTATLTARNGAVFSYTGPVSMFEARRIVIEQARAAGYR